MHPAAAQNHCPRPRLPRPRRRRSPMTRPALIHSTRQIPWGRHPPTHRPLALPQPPADHAPSTSLERVMQQVRLNVGENKFADALLILSQLYGNPDLPASQAREVTQILDQIGRQGDLLPRALVGKRLPGPGQRHLGHASPSATRCRPCCWRESTASAIRRTFPRARISRCSKAPSAPKSAPIARK